MSNIVKEVLRKIKLYKFDRIFEFIVAEIVAKVYLQTLRKSFSQKQEDLLLDKLLAGHRGIYVDIGANDPHRFSNTKRFYLRGWNGINIEPNPINFKRFLTDRPRDINVNCGIGSPKRVMTFYVMFPDTLSTFSKISRDESRSMGFVNEKILRIPILPLSTVLSKHCGRKKIAFFSLDTEGYDYNVLVSNDWNKFRPRLICIEAHVPYAAGSVRGGSDRKNEMFLKKHGYIPVAHTPVNDIYLDTYAS